MKPESDDLALTLDRVLDAPRAAIWRCWTAEARKQHEYMGFRTGLNAAADQLKKLAKTL